MGEPSVPTGNRLKIAAAVTGLFVIAEFAIGYSANSLALISDAGHNLTDVLALVMSAWAFAKATQSADGTHTFGHYRVGVLVALANVLALGLLAGYIFFEAYQRLLAPEPVASIPMIVVASVAFVLNGTVVLWLQEGSRDDVNVRSAMVHMAGDALSSVGVLLAGIAVLLTGSSLWDPAISVVIGLFILWSGWGIIQETIRILLEGTPAGLNLADVTRDIEQLPGVQGVHDLHAWSLGSDVRALSAHVVIGDPSTVSQHEVTKLVGHIKRELAMHHDIAHATIETHCFDCPDDACSSPCDIQPVEAGSPQTVGHQHGRIRG